MTHSVFVRPVTSPVISTTSSSPPPPTSQGVTSSAPPLAPAGTSSGDTIPISISTTSSAITSNVGPTSASPTNTPTNPPASTFPFSLGSPTSASSGQSLTTTSQLTVQSAASYTSSSVGIHPSAFTANAPESNDHVRTIVLASAIPSGVVLLTLLVWLLRRWRARDQRREETVVLVVEEEAIAVDAEPHPQDDIATMELVAALKEQDQQAVRRKEQDQQTVHRVSTLSEVPPQSEILQAATNVTDGSETIVATSDQGSIWHDMPRTPGGHSDAPPPYDSLSSAE